MSADLPRAAILGVSGTVLTPWEQAFFAETRPFGFILFGRNIESPEQVAALTAAMRDSVGRADAPVLVDQEGGRVQRLGPPHWRKMPPWGVFGALYARDALRAVRAAKVNARLMAHELAAVGIDTNCLPVLDVPQPGADGVIGDRAFSADLGCVIELGKAVVEGLLSGGVYPVIKHLPGHGRAPADSHLSLPRVGASLDALDKVDFAAFRAFGDAAFGMTAHVVYDALDPGRPATLSPVVIEDCIRKSLGFRGLLMSDDLSMKALDGPFEARTRAALEAGCDLVLHCNGDRVEMEAVMRVAKALDLPALDRWKAARATRMPPDPGYDPKAAEALLAELLG